MPASHTDEIALSIREGGTFRQSGDFGFLSDATVTSADTVAGLTAAVNAAVVHADTAPARERITRTITVGAALTDLTDARVLNLTSIAGLVGLTADANGNNRDLLFG